MAQEGPFLLLEPCQLHSQEPAKTTRLLLQNALASGVGVGVVAGGIAARTGLGPICRTGAPKLLRIASPIPN